MTETTHGQGSPDRVNGAVVSGMHSIATIDPIATDFKSQVSLYRFRRSRRGTTIAPVAEVINGEFLPPQLATVAGVTPVATPPFFSIKSLQPQRNFYATVAAKGTGTIIYRKLA